MAQSSFHDYNKILQIPPDDCPKGSDAACRSQNTASSATENGILPEACEPTKPQIRIRFADITDVRTQGFIGSTTQIVPTDRFSPPQKKSDKTSKLFQDYALILRRIVESNGKCIAPQGSYLELQSPRLCKSFRTLVGHAYDGTDLHSTPIKISWPFDIVFYNRDKIKSFIEDKSKNDEDSRAEMELLQNFISSDLDLQYAQEQYNEYVVARSSVTNPILWSIYEPNSILVFTSGEIKECWLCRNVTMHMKGRLWVVHGVRLDFDGERLGMVSKQYEIPFFYGVVDIASLPLVPIKWLPEWESEIRDQMLQRGRFYKTLLGDKLKGCSHYVYDGPMWSMESSERPDLQVGTKLLYLHESSMLTNLSRFTSELWLITPHTWIDTSECVRTLYRRKSLRSDSKTSNR
jgi:hypothetical protein